MDAKALANDIYLILKTKDCFDTLQPELSSSDVLRLSKERVLIKKRYNELIENMSFQEAYKIAICEWMEKYLIENGA